MTPKQKALALLAVGALGWMFIGGYAAVAIGVTLALIGATTLVRHLLRAEGG